MDTYEWHYSGDVNLRHDGFYWREDSSDDQAWIVRITPLSMSGGPDNLFRVEAGYLHLPENESIRRSALSIIGVEPGKATQENLVHAFESYHALDVDEERVIRIGKPDEFWSGRGDPPEPDVVLRSDASLRKYVTREFLHAEPVISASVAGP
jgi:hypothetical protein